MDWKSYDHDNKATWPTEAGAYRVMVSGDSEQCDGHTIYEYPDYPTWVEAGTVEDDDGNDLIGFARGPHDEEPESFFAYYGPMPIPVYNL